MLLDLSQVRFSRYDRRRGITVPNKPSADLAEEVAIHLGDGYLFYDLKDRSYRYGIGLNPKKEQLYAEEVASILEKLYGIRPRVYNARIEVMSLAIGTFKHLVLKFPIGSRNGTERLPYINWVFSNEEFMISFIRGLVDTEGSIKKLSRTIAVVIKMRNRKIIEALYTMINRIGIKAKVYMWAERGKPIYAVIITGNTNVKDFIFLVKPRNKRIYSDLNY